MIVIPATTTEGENAAFIGLNAEDIKTMLEHDERFAVIDFHAMELTDKTKSAWKVVLIFGPTDEAVKKKITENHRNRQFDLQ